MKKYEILNDDFLILGGVKLFRIKSLITFGDVKDGDIGGYIESEKNLAHTGNAWVSGNARVSGIARVSGDAEVSGNAKVYGDALVYGNVWVYGNARVSVNANVSNNADLNKGFGYFTVTAIGSRHGTTTFYITKDKGIFVACGCFNGSMAEFKLKVSERHSGTKYEAHYLKACELAELMLE